MSNFALIRTNGPMPPGGFQFSDPITGKKYADLHTSFEGRVAEIIRDRNANHRLFTDDRLVSAEHVSRELSEFCCRKLKNNPMFCSNGLPQINQLAPVSAPVAKRCRHCGSNDLEEILCPTCSGRKVIGYKCKACGRQMQ